MNATVRQLRPELEAVFLVKENALSWKLMPEYLERVVKFHARDFSDEKPDTLIKNIMLDFTDDRHVYCLPVVLKEGRIIAHGLITLRAYGEKRFAHIAQMEFDKGEGMEIPAVNGLMESVELWAHQNQCKELEAWVEEGAQERRLRTFHGFKHYRIVMRRPL